MLNDTFRRCAITFDEVMLEWLTAEVKQIEGRNILPLAQSKGFNSITEWRLATAVRLGMDTKQWRIEQINNPNEVLPNIIIGPFQGWSKFFDNKIDTTFAQALEIPAFFDWCTGHDRIQPIAANFPSATSLILFRKPNGQLIHIEGGHRICAVAYGIKINKPIDLNGKTPITAMIADIVESQIPGLIEFLRRGTFKQQKTL
jgi:hypothetical protein